MTTNLEGVFGPPLFFVINSSMAALDRQPDKLDYLSPTQFRFGIHQLPKVQFFTTSANIPGINMGEAIFPTPFKDIPIMGDKITYENLEISFIVDEFLENYRSLHEWMTAIGFPEDNKQFSTFRGETSNTPIETQGGPNRDIGIEGVSTAARSMFSDATLTILSNKNNPIAEVRFEDLYPITLGALEFNQNATDVEYLTVSADFAYKIYKIIPL